MWGGSVETAYAAQAALALVVSVSLVWLWRGPAADELKAAALPCACLLTTPYVLDYDLVVLAVPIAFLVRYGLAHGFREYEISLLALAWTAPLIARGFAGASGVPLGLIAVLLLYALTLRRAAPLSGSGLGAVAPRMWRFRSPHHSCRESDMRTSEPSHTGSMSC